MFKQFTGACLLLISTNLSAQEIVINEIVSSNSIIQDENGNTPDLIELYNTSSSSVSLGNYFLSDSKKNIFKSPLPDIIIEPYNFVTLFASGIESILFWETIVDQGDIWRYRPVTSAIDDNWINPGFDDGLWDTGPSGIGYGDNDDATIINPVMTVYLRHNFYVPDTTSLEKIFLHVDYDDAFVAYLNGVEIARSNIGVPGVRPGYSQEAITYSEARIYQGLKPEAYNISEYKTLLKTGENLLAVEVHNFGVNSSDLTIIPFLSLGFSRHSDINRGTNPLLGLQETLFHTNFKIDNSGEKLFLSRNDGEIVDSVVAVSLMPDNSYGRKPDGSANWYFFETPTIGSANTSEGFNAYSDSVYASLPGGFYSNEITVSLSASNINDVIYFTLDGSVPQITSGIYNAPIKIDKTSVLRTRVLSSQNLPGVITTETYFINENCTLPVISLITNPENLWDENQGIYVRGPNAENTIPYFGANFWQDWEKPAQIQFFEEDKTFGFESACGIKIFGAWSRAHAQKSLSVFFRGEYGNPELTYPIFPELDIKTYQSFILRNSGNDWNATMLRDAFTQSMLSNVDVDCQAYRPVLVYINGEYWGIHNLREKISEHYIAAHHKIDSPEIDLLENNNNSVIGTTSEFQQLLNYVSNNNMQTAASYDYVSSKIDLNAYFNYMCTQIFIDNTDWPGNNVKYWRPQTENGKWRWILYDTDFGFGFLDANGYRHNTLAFALEDNGPDWPNPPWSTLLFRKLLENQKIKQDFINRFADLLNTNFNGSKLLAVLDSINNKISPEISRHLARWGQNINNRNVQMQRIKDFVRTREIQMRAFIGSVFSLSGTSLIKLNADDGGQIQINSINIAGFPWQAYYFNNIPVTITAIPKPGYKFTGWTGDSISTSESLQINPFELFNITAKFESVGDTSKSIVINEINYHSADSFNTEDWIEIYNRGDNDVNLSGWRIKDSSHEFVFPENTLINARSYRVIVQSIVAFSGLFPQVTNFTGETGFGFSSDGEAVALYDYTNQLVDSVFYMDNAPWPVLADGQGSTLELKNPQLDNSLAINWQASTGFGTPGIVNSAFVSGLKENDGNTIAQDFSLEQNFPNPFNPSTKIRYKLAKSAHVTIKIFGTNGQQVLKVIDATQAAGQHQINLNTDHMASGIYFYSIYFDNKHFQTRKMIKIQ